MRSGKQFEGFNLKRAQSLQQLAQQLVLMREAFEAAHQTLQQDGTVCTQAAQILLQRVHDRFGVESSDTTVWAAAAGVASLVTCSWLPNVRMG